MLLVIVKANLYGDNSFTTNGNFLVSNYGVKYNLLLTVNNIEILFKFKSGSAAILGFGGPEITFSTNMVIAAHANVRAAMPSLVPSLKISQVPKTTRSA